MARHVNAGGEITYYFCPLGRLFPRIIRTPKWWDELVGGEKDNRIVRALDYWLSKMWVIRSRVILYD